MLLVVEESDAGPRLPERGRVSDMQVLQEENFPPSDEQRPHVGRDTSPRRQPKATGGTGPRWRRPHESIALPGTSSRRMRGRRDDAQWSRHGHTHNLEANTGHVRGTIYRHGRAAGRGRRDPPAEQENADRPDRRKRAATRNCSSSPRTPTWSPIQTASSARPTAPLPACSTSARPSWPASRWPTTSPSVTGRRFAGSCYACAIRI